jgi:acid phosphatase class B
MPKPIISFDFDDTLCMEDGTPNYTMMGLVHQYAAEGYKCYVVTSRDKSHESLSWIKKNGATRIRVKDFIRDHQLPIKQCHFTNHERKGETLQRIGAIKHYDDNDAELMSAKAFGIEAIKTILPE